MNEANTAKLYADFPRLYRNATNEESCMKWGFLCGNGWFDLIYKLSADIEAEATKLALKPAAWPMALQVKEKFGTLSFYCAAGKRNSDGRGMLPSIRALIEKASADSATICEGCGRPAKIKTEGYWSVLCDECRELNAQARKEK